MSEPSPGAARPAAGMVKADLVSGLAFVALGIATVVESLPAFAELEAEFYTAPGIVPGLLGAALALLGALLVLRAAAGPRGGGHAETAGDEHAWPRVGAAFALCMGYAGVLVSRIPFELATFVFILAFMLIFELWDGKLRDRWLRQSALGVGVAALLAFGISYVFEAVFLIRLP
jgi:putative tricarboxylic transport membrane protein